MMSRGWDILIGKQLPQPRDRVAHDAAEHVVEVLPRIHAACLAGLDQPKIESRSAGAPVAGCKQPVLPPQREGPDCILGQVVVRPEAAVFEVTVKSLPLVQGIVDGLSKRLGGKGLDLELSESLEDRVQNGPAVLFPVPAPVGIVHLRTLRFHFVELGDAAYDLRRLLGAGGCGLIELTPGMHPAADLDNAILAEELIIAAIGIRVGIAAITIQEIQRSLLASVMRKIIHRQRWTAASAHIRPQPGLLHLSAPLDLKRDDGVVGKDHTCFEHRLFQCIPKKGDRFVDPQYPVRLGGPGDVHSLPLKDPVLR